MALTEKVKTALDETRLLILGSQILFGFQLNGMFQDAFEQVSTVGRSLNACGFFLMASSVGLLLAPSMQHRLVERGQDTVRMQRATNLLAALALIPFAPSLGITFYIVLERHVGAAAAAGVAFSALETNWCARVSHSSLLPDSERIVSITCVPKFGHSSITRR
jgi:hypothetical protein